MTPTSSGRLAVNTRREVRSGRTATRWPAPRGRSWRRVGRRGSVALHNTGQYENNRVECDHGRLKARLRPMHGLKTERTASVVIRGTRSSRTCDVATTSWQSTPRRSSGWPPHSTNSGPQCDQPVPGGITSALPLEQTTQQSRRVARSWLRPRIERPGKSTHEVGECRTAVRLDSRRTRRNRLAG